jgi:dTDP-4-dehydrorhamnose 3,5-epimerase-like enzyme
MADVVEVPRSPAYVVETTIHGDERGIFIETYRREWFPQGREMIQGNRGNRQAGAVVGLHYHLHQADYWYVPMGSARVVLHDLRVGSPTEPRNRSKARSSACSKSSRTPSPARRWARRSERSPNCSRSPSPKSPRAGR